jgi:hypothetical protein
MTLATVFTPRKNLLRYVNEDRFCDLARKFASVGLFKEADSIIINCGWV